MYSREANIVDVFADSRHPLIKDFEMYTAKKLIHLSLNLIDRSADILSAFWLEAKCKPDTSLRFGLPKPKDIPHGFLCLIVSFWPKPSLVQTHNEAVSDVIVAKDGSGQFLTIGEALLAYPKEPVNKFIKYLKNIYMYGDDPRKTIVTGNKNRVSGVQNTWKTASFCIPKIASTTKEVDAELLPLVRVYKDGSVERLFQSVKQPPLFEGDPRTGVSSKDVVFSDDPPLSARIHLPKLKGHGIPQQKLPILVYFHGGGFCIGSPFDFISMHFLNDLVSLANIIAVSVEYRLAPEHPLPAAYDDCWAALQWVASHFADRPMNSEAWLINHGDVERIYIGGDSAGGNIVHNMCIRAGTEKLYGNVKLLGAFMTHPYFWGSKPIGSEPLAGHEQSFNRQVWNFVYPSAPGGIDNPMINPIEPGAPSLGGLACSKLLVCVAGKDTLRERGVLYAEAVRKSGWEGEVDLFEDEEEDHSFHIIRYGSESSKRLIQRLASFIN